MIYLLNFVRLFKSVYASSCVIGSTAVDLLCFCINSSLYYKLLNLCNYACNYKLARIYVSHILAVYIFWCAVDMAILFLL